MKWDDFLLNFECRCEIDQVLASEFFKDNDKATQEVKSAAKAFRC